MKIYNYDKESKEFLFPSVAQKNPKRDGEYIFPKYSTTIIPPKPEANQAAVFNGKFWELVPDYRGQEQIDLTTKEISKVEELGRLKDGFSLYSDYILTQEYKDGLVQQEIEAKRNEIIFEIDTLDRKRIRAVCEPSVKDASTGETWLDYYNTQILTLREKLMEVDNDTSC